MTKRHAALFIVPALIGLAGCVDPGEPVVQASNGAEAAAAAPLRAKTDLARGIRWELDWAQVSAYDLATGQLVRTVPLPGATLAGAADSCHPDLLLGRTGSLIVSSNVEPVLWRVSPARYEVERFEIAVDNDHDKDFGFTALAWSVDERILLAASSATGTLWRIDLATAQATRIEHSPSLPGACGLRSIPG